MNNTKKFQRIFTAARAADDLKTAVEKLVNEVNKMIELLHNHYDCEHHEAFEPVAKELAESINICAQAANKKIKVAILFRISEADRAEAAENSLKN